MGVVHEKVEKSALHGSIRHGKSSQPRTQQRMLANQCKCVAPDGYAILPSFVVFVSKSLKSHDHGLASHPKKHSHNAEEKHCGDRRPSSFRSRVTPSQNKTAHNP